MPYMQETDAVKGCSRANAGLTLLKSVRGNDPREQLPCFIPPVVYLVTLIMMFVTHGKYAVSTSSQPPMSLAGVPSRSGAAVNNIEDATQILYGI